MPELVPRCTGLQRPIRGTGLGDQRHQRKGEAMRKFLMAAALVAVAACGEKKVNTTDSTTMAPPPAMAPTDSAMKADSIKRADSMRVADSIKMADSMAKM